ncbi:BnaAnng18670D [Brassica napus]|uniref:BnaAnng18670D protein n=1 Tax=Brassica napus TaxID=3708 RepID=A0A078JDR6_BRANA|nr:BnaAnng18670D [Brassica napus]
MRSIDTHPTTLIYSCRLTSINIYPTVSLDTHPIASIDTHVQGRLGEIW